MTNGSDNTRLTPEESWPKMEQQLDRYFVAKRRKRRMLFYSVAFLLLAGGYYFISDSVESITKRESVPDRQSAVGSQQSAVGSQQSIVGSQQSVVGSQQSAVGSRRSAVGSQQSAVGGQQSIVDNRNPQPATRNSQPATRNLQPVSEQQSAVGSQQSIVDNRNSQPATRTSSEVPGSTIQVASEQSAVSSQQSAVDNRNSQPATRNSQPVREQQSAVGSQQSALDNRNSQPVTRNPQPVSEQQSAVGGQQSAVISQESQPVTRSPQPDSAVRHHTPLLIDVSISKQTVLRSLSAADAQWTGRRNDEEEIGSAYNYSLSLVRPVGNWRFGAGIEYGRWNETTWYSGDVFGDSLVDNSYWTYSLDTLDTLYLSGNQYFLRDATPNTVDSIYFTLFDTVTGQFTDPALQTRNAPVRWTYVEVPVRVGYMFGSGKLAFGGRATLAPGMITAVKGQYLDRSEDRLTAAKDLAPVRRFQLSAALGLCIEYRFMDRWSAYVSPEWRKQFYSVYSRASGINQRYSSYGLAAGITWQLSRP
ncbi:MAG: hypothetical protein RL213_1445 [Bacteroidota bacterium]